MSEVLLSGCACYQLACPINALKTKGKEMREIKALNHRKENK